MNPEEDNVSAEPNDKECMRCGGMTDELWMEAIGVEEDGSDYIYDYDSLLCSWCYDDRCTKYNIGPLP